jgi:uncharacterized membrane protein YqgA involved in biofilm formation
MIGIGTMINAVAVVVGGALGAVLGARLPERVRETIMHGLGLLTLTIGIHLSFETDNILIVLGSLLLGGIGGELLRIEDRLNGIGRWLEQKTTRNDRKAAADVPEDTTHASTTRFSRAFLTASLVFCVGPMTILGSFQDGLTGDYKLLAVKSALDFFAALAFASTLGPGVISAALTVLVYQGALTLGAGWASSALTDSMIAEMTATGGVLMLALGLGLLEIKQIRAGNLLPAIIAAPIIVAVIEWAPTVLPPVVNLGTYGIMARLWAVDRESTADLGG